MKLTTVNAKKQEPKGETGESRLRPSHGQTGGHFGPQVGFEEIIHLISPKPVSGQSTNIDSSVATRAFVSTNPKEEPILPVIRQ